jgi:hypothetical protein
MTQLSRVDGQGISGYGFGQLTWYNPKQVCSLKNACTLFCLLYFAFFIGKAMFSIGDLGRIFETAH